MRSDHRNERANDDLIFEALLAGDDRAFTRAFQRLHPEILAVVRADVNADEIIVDSFAILHARIVDGTIVSERHVSQCPVRHDRKITVVKEGWKGLTRWLKQVARWSQRKHWRRSMARRVDDHQSAEPTADEKAYLDRDAMFKMLDFVAKHHPDKLWLLQRWLHGFSWSEIAADDRARSAGAAKMSLTRLCRVLREHFDLV